MTTAADDSAAEEAFEAYLAGRLVPEEAARLAAFAEAVRSSASRPGRPNAALADLLATGLLTDQSSPSARTATTGGRPRASRVRIRRRIAMFFPALLAKIASAGAVAQAATGAGIVLVAFTGAGTAGVLPDSLQHGFATVADTVGVQVADPLKADEDATTEATTPTDGTDGDAGADSSGTSVDENGDGNGDDNGDVAEQADEPAQAPQSFDEWAASGPAEGQSFGDWVSWGAEHGWADGATISHWAHEKHVEWPEDTTVTSPTPTEDAGADTTGTEVESDSGRGSGGTSGRGNGNSGHGSSGHGGSGNGNSGHGNSGHGNSGHGGSDDGDSGHGNR